MRTMLAAVIAFNVYSYVFVCAFWAATPLLFHANEIHDLTKHGLPVQLDVWGFDQHYIWRFIAAVVSTALAGFISGAVGRDRTGKAAAWSNAPSIGGWLFYAAVCFFRYPVEPPESVAAEALGWGTVSVIAIPITTWVAFHFARLGAAKQTEWYADDSVLGVARFHWVWFPFALDVYGYRIVHAFVLFVLIKLKTWFTAGLLAGLISLLGILVVVAWIYPPILVYEILTRERLEEKSAAYRAAVVVLILIGGFLAAHWIQMACAWVFEKFGV